LRAMKSFAKGAGIAVLAILGIGTLMPKEEPADAVARPSCVAEVRSRLAMLPDVDRVAVNVCTTARRRVLQDGGSESVYVDALVTILRGS